MFSIKNLPNYSAIVAVVKRSSKLLHESREMANLCNETKT